MNTKVSEWRKRPCILGAHCRRKQLKQLKQSKKPIQESSQMHKPLSKKPIKWPV